MASDQDPVALAKWTIDSNRYMTLGTTDEAGHPWVSPVFYAARGYAEFYWMSSPEVTHSPVSAAELQPAAVYRLYRATVSQHSVLCPGSKGLPARSTGGHSTTGPG